MTEESWEEKATKETALLCELCSQNNVKEVMAMLKDQGIHRPASADPIYQAFLVACQKGSLDVVQYLVEHGGEVFVKAQIYVDVVGLDDVIKRAVHYDEAGDIVEASDFVYMYSDPGNKVNWTIDAAGWESPDEVANYSPKGEYPSTAVVQVHHRLRREHVITGFVRAITRGYRSVFDYLYRWLSATNINKEDWMWRYDTSILAAAAEYCCNHDSGNHDSGNHDSGNYDTATADHALWLFQYLLDHGLDVSDYLCIDRIINTPYEHIETVKLLYSEHLKYSRPTFANHSAVTDYISKCTQTLYRTACKKDYVNIVKYLHGYVLNQLWLCSAFNEAVHNKSWRVVLYLLHGNWKWLITCPLVHLDYVYEYALSAIYGEWLKSRDRRCLLLCECIAGKGIKYRAYYLRLQLFGVRNNNFIDYHFVHTGWNLWTSVY